MSLQLLPPPTREQLCAIAIERAKVKTCNKCKHKPNPFVLCVKHDGCGLMRKHWEADE